MHVVFCSEYSLAKPSDTASRMLPALLFKAQLHEKGRGSSGGKRTEKGEEGERRKRGRGERERERGNGVPATTRRDKTGGERDERTMAKKRREKIFGGVCSGQVFP